MHTITVNHIAACMQAARAYQPQLWDLVPQSPTLACIPYTPMLEALRRAQRLESAR